MSDNSLNQRRNYLDNFRIRVKFDENSLKAENVTFVHKQVVNICIVYETNLWPFTVGQHFTLENPMFEAVKLTQNADLDKYKYSNYGMGFDVNL